MAQLAAQAGALGLTHDTSLAVEQVAVPSCIFGAPFLERWPTRDLPGGVHWQDASYASYSPWVFTIPQARVHSTAGIVCVGGFAIAETLAHTRPADHAYTDDADGIWIDEGETPISGTHLSVLAAGAPGNYYHTLLDGVGRLSVVPGPVLDMADGLLAVPDRPSPASWLLDRVAATSRLRRTAVHDGSSLRVERLVLAGPHSTTSDFHPALAAWFEARVAKLDHRQDTPSAIYIDRRRAAARPLLNEAELIASLEALGVVAVALEALSPTEQIALFRNARCIIAPHGAGLANLAFAKPGGCRVLELQMDAYCHWCFRRLAALKRLRYDCILGRAETPWRDVTGPVHGSPWSVSVPHVVAAVQAMMAR